MPVPHAPIRQAPPAQAELSAAPAEVEPPRNPFVGIEWSISYVGLLGFVFAITTYALNIGQISIIVALIGLLTQKHSLRVPLLLQGLFVFLLWCGIGTLTTSWPTQVQEKVLDLAKIWLVALVAANALRTRAQIRFFHFFYLACFAFWPVRGALFNYYIYGQTIFGRAIWKYVYENPNDLAAYCILQLSLALALYYKEKWSVLKIGALLGVFVLPFLVLLTKSRGAFLALAAFIALLIAGGRRRVRATMVTVLVGATVLMVVPKDSLERLAGMSKLTSTETVGEADQEGSAFQRYTIWKVARTIVKENWVMGVGLGGYSRAHWRAAVRPQFHPTARGMRDTHSTYLNLLAETGVLGFLLYFFSYGMTLYHIMQVRKRSKELLPASSQALYVQFLGVLAFYIAGIFGSVAHVSFLILQVTAVWAFSEIVDAELARRRVAYRRPESDRAPLLSSAAGAR
jgi:O-antigen ligase